MPPASRSVTGSGRCPRSISRVFWKKCFIETATPRATSGRKDCVESERASGVTTTVLIGDAGFFGKGFIDASRLHGSGLGAAARHRELRRRSGEGAKVRPGLEEARRDRADEEDAHDDQERLRDV